MRLINSKFQIESGTAPGEAVRPPRLPGFFRAGIIFFTAGVLHAQLIDVDFNNDSYGATHGGPNPGPTMSGAAVLGAAADQWNGISASSGSGVSLFYANGSASGVTMTFTSGGGYDAYSFSGSTPFAGTAYDALMEDYLFNSGVAQTITLSGLAANSAYNLVLYNAGDNAAAGRKTMFTVNGTTQTSVWNATSSTLIAGVDYVDFTAALSDGSGNLVITYTGNGSAEGDINGFQIQGPPGPALTPTVTILNPTNGAALTAPANVNIAASATVSLGTVTNVQFFANGVSLGSILTPPFSVTAGNLTAGAYTLAALATAAGISVTSQVVNVSVAGPAAANNGAGYSWSIFAGADPYGSADGPGAAAQFSGPFGNVVDTNGYIYVADTYNNTIRKLTPQGVVSTIAGFPGVAGTNDGVGNAARFNSPSGIAIDRAGNLYVSDFFNATIRKLTPAGTNWMVSTIAGLAGNPGSADGTNSAARFGSLVSGMQIGVPLQYLLNFILPPLMGLAVDASTNIYVADTFNCTIRKITPVGTNWVVSTIAGTSPNTTRGGSGFFNEYPPEGYNYTNGTGTNAAFCYPCGIAVDSNGVLYVTDTGNNAIRTVIVTPLGGIVNTIAGFPQFDFNGVPLGGNINGNGSDAQNYNELQFNFPVGITVDGAGNLFVAEVGNNDVRELKPGLWSESTFAGAGSSGNNGSTNAVGSNARFNSPRGVTAVGSAGNPNFNLYVSDTGNNEIRDVNLNAVASLFAGSVPNPGDVDATGVNARLEDPQGLTIDSAGKLYVAETGNETIRQIGTNAAVTTIAGTGGVAGTNNGVFSGGQFYQPSGVAVDSGGNVYVADTENMEIRKITANAVSTIAGFAGSQGANDGIGGNARFDYPSGITVDKATNLYVADTYNNTIRKITPLLNQLGAITNWVVNTIAGQPQFDPYGNPLGGSADGTNNVARFDYPYGIAVDGAGNLYVADEYNFTIRKIKPVGTNWVVSTIAGYAGSEGTNDGTGGGARFELPLAIAIDSAGDLFVADDGAIRKITPVGANWMVSTIGNENAYGVALDSAGDLYVTTSYNNTVLKGVFTAYGAYNAVPYPQPAMNGQLVVTLLPAAANGQWRFPWEVAWRTNGQTASNLVAGNYPVEFRTLSGWLAVPPTLTVPVTNGGTTFATNQYYPTASTVDTNLSGTLTITLGTPPVGGWRFLGDTTSFYPAGSTNLMAGTYLIQFEPVVGRVTPPNLSVQVQAGLTTVLAESYLIPQTSTNGFYLPFPVPANNISDLVDYPFGFNGQLQSDVGSGSGVAVQANVVLTAAHLVFNDQTLAYVSQAYWYFQQETGVFQPEPMAARGWYVLSGYAAQRDSDLTNNYAPDQSSPQSRNFDVAALYFLSPAAGGGYGGYLPSDASPNPWLTGNGLKMLVGYPVDGSQFGVDSIVPGEMYQTQPQPFALNLATDTVTNQQEVYADPYLLSYPGNSGGPLYVQFNGYYYPAGVYLGTLYNGATPYASAVRAIDSNVVSLITSASALGDSGTNNSGGGVITIIPSLATSLNNPGYLILQLGPPAAVQAGAAWKFNNQPAADYSSVNPSLQEVVTTNALALQFKPVPGWILPTNQSVVLVPGQIVTNTASYSVTNPVLVAAGAGLGITGTPGTLYRLDRRTSLTGGSWLPVSTNTILNSGFNLLLSQPDTNGSTFFYRAFWLGQ
jgi:sugar lactone lactonase YvrE